MENLEFKLSENFKKAFATIRKNPLLCNIKSTKLIGMSLACGDYGTAHGIISDTHAFRNRTIKNHHSSAANSLNTTKNQAGTIGIKSGRHMEYKTQPGYEGSQLNIHSNLYTHYNMSAIKNRFN